MRLLLKDRKAQAGQEQNLALLQRVRGVRLGQLRDAFAPAVQLDDLEDFHRSVPPVTRVRSLSRTREWDGRGLPAFVAFVKSLVAKRSRGLTGRAWEIVGVPVR